MQDNVFLDVQEVSYPRYPTPKLGDFGLAIRTHTYDPQNPAWYNGGTGTPGFRAPEQVVNGTKASASGLGRGQLLAHTNVFGVGAIMWSLANRTLCYDVKLDALRQTRRVAGENAEKLSSTLISLVRDCLAFKIEDRKTFAQLQRAIRLTTEAKANDGDLFKYISNARSGQQSEEAKYDLLDFVYNKYPLGLALWAPT